MSQSSQGQEPIIRIGSLIPENQELLSVEPGDSVYTAISYMKRHNYSQLPVMDASERFFGVISWRSIGEQYTSPDSPSPELVSHCTDSKVQPVSGDQSLFDPATIEEIDIRDFIVLKDEAGMVVGIVTAADLATRFERFGKAFAITGEIELRLRDFVQRKFSDEEIGKLMKLSHPEIPGQASFGRNRSFWDFVKLLHYGSSVLPSSIDREHFHSDIEEVRLIRNRLMHFHSGELEEATDSDIETLQNVLKGVMELQ